VIFVVDSADKERIEVAKQELELMLQEEELKGVPVLLLANKQDLPNALNEQDVINSGRFNRIYRFAMGWDCQALRIDLGLCSKYQL
jgi:GTPase SAR1 family protein